MPATAAGPSPRPAATAPDGIAIHTFAVAPAAWVGVAEGRIGPGRYSVHRHLTIEQYTYVIAGQLTAIVGDEDCPEGRAVPLEPGDLMLTAPGESLSFHNTGVETAQVLFICAPPYPIDDADTHVLEAHDVPAEDELRAAAGRLESLRTAFNDEIDTRLATIRRALDRGRGQA